MIPHRRWDRPSLVSFVMLVIQSSLKNKEHGK